MPNVIRVERHPRRQLAHMQGDRRRFLRSKLFYRAWNASWPVGRSRELLRAVYARTSRWAQRAVLHFPVHFFGPHTVSFSFPHLALQQNICAEKNCSLARSAITRCPHQRLQLCGNARCTSLNIMFLTACIFCNFLAKIAAIF